MADYYKGSAYDDVRDYSGKKKKPKEEQLTIPNLFGHGKKKAKNIDFFKKDNTYPV